MSEDAVIIRKDSKGELDEIVARNAMIHIEQMSADGWYIGIDGSDGSYHQFWLGAKNGRAAVVMRHTESTPAVLSREEGK